MQIACRDKNRIAIQGDVLGAAAMGVANILCLTGDGVQCGDQPEAKPVFDLDSISLLNTVRTMRDEKRFLSGRKITSPPQVFIGAAVNPFVPPLDYRPIHFAKKIAAGAQFVQTQYCYDVPLLKRFMARVREQGLHEKCFILVGVGPAGLGQDRALDALLRARRAHPGRDRRPDREGRHAQGAEGARASSSASS